MKLNGYTLSHALSQALMALSLLGLSAASMAEKADRNKPMQIDADKVTYNEAKQQQVFTGNVILTKGTLVIKAQRVETRLDAQGYQQAIATGTAAQPASYAQKREGLDETIEAQALTLTFDGKADTVVLADQAIVRRLVKNVVQDESRGATIKYNNQTEFYEIDGGATSSQAGGRVRMILAPRLTPSN